MKKLFGQINNWYHALPDKKKYVEFISAALTIPMLLTVILINLNNIKNQSKPTTANTTSTTATPIQIVITGSPGTNQPEPSTPQITSLPTTIPSPTLTLAPTPSTTACLQEIGPIEILSPQEGEIIATDKVCINVSTDSKYCPLVWSYQIDSDTWSDFSNNNICLYNLSNGPKKLQIRFKNPTTSKTLTLGRNFIYQNPNITSTPTLTPTISLTPTP